MKRLLIVGLILFPLSVFAQRIEKYNDYAGRPSNNINARFFVVVEKKDSLWHRREYYIREKKPYLSGYYLDSSCTQGQGAFAYYYANGRLKQVGQYIKGRKHGTWKSWTAMGQLIDSSHYYSGVQAGTNYKWHSNGRLSDSITFDTNGNGVHYKWFDNGNISTSGPIIKWKKEGEWIYYHMNGKPSIKEIYVADKLTGRQLFSEAGMAINDTGDTDSQPAFPGGDKGWKRFLQKHAYFPEDFKINNNTQAVIVIGATIAEDGTVAEIEVLSPLHPKLDEAAVTFMKKSPRWQPAIRHNRRVKEMVILTINVYDVF